MLQAADERDKNEVIKVEGDGIERGHGDPKGLKDPSGDQWRFPGTFGKTTGA